MTTRAPAVLTNQSFNQSFLLERAHQAMLAKCHQATTMISFHGKPPDPNTNLKDYNEMSAFWSILTIHIFPVTVSNHTFFLQNNSSLCVNKVTFCKKRSVLCSGSDMEP